MTPGPRDPVPGDSPEALLGTYTDGQAPEPGPRRPPPEAVVHRADRWRVVGITLALLWVVLLLAVVGLWLRVTWYPGPDDEVLDFVPVILAPAAVVSALLAGWSVAAAWRLYRRRRSGWDAPIVLGALAVAVAAYSLVPSTTTVPDMPWLGLLGLGSVVAGVLGEREWRRLG